MPHQYSITPIKISTRNLREFGLTHDTVRIDKLVTILQNAGFSVTVKHIDENHNTVSPFLEVTHFGDITEQEPTSRTTEIKSRFDALIVLTGANIDDDTCTVTSANGTVNILSFNE